MATHLDREHGVAMHSMTAASIRIINDAQTVEVLLFSPDADPLATVEVSKSKAVRLVGLPVTMGHVFRAARERVGGVFVEPVE